MIRYQSGGVQHHAAAFGAQRDKDYLQRKFGNLGGFRALQSGKPQRYHGQYREVAYKLGQRVRRRKAGGKRQSGAERCVNGCRSCHKNLLCNAVNNVHFYLTIFCLSPQGLFYSTICRNVLTLGEKSVIIYFGNHIIGKFASVKWESRKISFF